MHPSLRIQRLSPAISFACAIVLLTCCVLLIFLQVRAVRAVARDAVPILQRLPKEERRLAVLSEQLEIAEFERAMRGGSTQEMLAAFVLPSDPDLDRLLSTVDTLEQWMRARKDLLSFSTIRADEAKPLADSPKVLAQSVTLEATVTPEGLQNLLKFLDLSGLLTVGDALTSDQLKLLLQATEEESPAALTAMEAFLSTDLLRYAREPKPFDEQLRRAFSSDAFDDTVAAILAGSLLEDAKHLLGSDLGRSLETQGLWPTRFLLTEGVEMSERGDGKVEVRLKLLALSRP